MPNYFSIPSCAAKLWPGHDSGIHKHTQTHTQTHTHTDRVNSICPSAILWWGHKKWFLLRGGALDGTLIETVCCVKGCSLSVCLICLTVISRVRFGRTLTAVMA